MIAKQSIEDFIKPDFIVVMRTYEHKIMSNNWLKMHGKPMRRKPFKKMSPPIFDEAWFIIGQRGYGRTTSFDTTSNDQMY